MFLAKTAFSLAVVVLCLSCAARARYEVMLNRVSYPNEIDTLDVIESLNYADICDQNWDFYNFNQSYISQPCFKKDVFYNMEMFIGEMNEGGSYQYLNMTLDLTSPISWIKLKTCKKCPSSTPIPPFSNNISQYMSQCRQSCNLNQHSAKTYNLKDKNAKQKILKKKAAIVNNNDEMFYGRYLIDNMKINLYNEHKRLSLIEKMENMMKINQLDNQNELIDYKQYKLLGVESIIGGSEYYSDGSIGLGFIDKLNYDEQFEDDTNFIENWLQDQDDNIRESLVWGLYLNDLSQHIEDLVMIVGGVNLKYSEQGSDDIINVRMLTDSRGFTWSLPIQMFALRFETYQYIHFPENTRAILTTSTSYIGLPKKQLTEFLSAMEKQGRIQCQVVDHRFYAVSCKNLAYHHINEQFFSVFFYGQDKEVRLDAHHFFRDCDKDPSNPANKNQKFECILNVRLSSDAYVVLGEPFLKQHYTVFYQDMNQVGFLPASQNKLYVEQYDRSIINWFIHFATVIFVSGMVFICCYRNARKMMQKIQFKIDSRHYRPDKIESQGLKVAGQDEDSMYQDVETAMKDEVLNEYKKNSQQI